MLSILFSLLFLGVFVFPAYLLLGLLRLRHAGRCVLACFIGGGLFFFLQGTIEAASAIALVLLCLWLVYLGRKKIAAENVNTGEPPSIFKS